jgi:hypothetical protein
VTYLELVELFHHEAKLPGDPPTALTGQVGRAADLVRWVAQAWKDIQLERHWKWMRRAFTLNTVADTASYAYTSCTDVLNTTAISRFKAWDFDSRDPMFIYLVSTGEASERPIAYLPWAEFRWRYVQGTHTSAYPTNYSIDMRNKLHFGPTPDAIYRVSGDYWISAQTLAEEEDDDDADLPEMPEDFHPLITYRGMTKYGYNVVAREILARVAVDGAAMHRALIQDQDYDRDTFTICGPLA